MVYWDLDGNPTSPTDSAIFDRTFHRCVYNDVISAEINLGKRRSIGFPQIFLRKSSLQNSFYYTVCLIESVWLENKIENCLIAGIIFPKNFAGKLSRAYDLFTIKKVVK